MGILTLHQLSCFVSVAEDLNFNKAAKRLHMSQPPLTRQIQGIESALGVQLFLRKASGVELTKAGETLLPEARAVLKRLDLAVDATQRAAKGQSGSLRIAYDSHSLYSVVPIAIRLFRRRFPDVDIRVEECSSAELVVGVTNGDLDAAFYTPPSTVAPGPEVERARLARLPCILALRSGDVLMQKKKLHLSDLKDTSFIVHSAQGSDVLRTRLIAACYQIGFAPKITASARSLDMVLGLVSAGLGVAVLSDAAQHFHRRNVHYCPLDTRGRLQLDFEFLWQSQSSSDCLLQFVEIVRTTAATLRRERQRREPELFANLAVPTS